MGTIDIKLKSYDELQFEVMTLTTNSYLKDLKIKELQERIDKAIEYIEHKRLYEEVVDYDFEENPIYVGANCEKARNDLLDILKGEE